ncbi:60 kDa lysophospholipase isoform X1 [Nannospalax galili]|uniref:60 kDa lysophospholipase isoform X1 n=2 Tax=Nannospalax galili TaxID=1026970 RepID=UPI0004ED3035|nr:60 kDa lysophospholipase isoform X1 [Nannospalax galili]
MARATGPERRLLAIYTGGTIGMRSEGGVLIPGKGLAAILRTLYLFHDEEYARAHGLPEDLLVLPPASPDQRIIYKVLECQPLFDSSDMTITEWVQIAQIIEKHYAQYQGFVVIHGTDTMAFAASVLSFMLENLQKPIILTGAQVPIHALWNDGRENLLGALLMAGQYIIPEVCLFFQNQLFRGNRTTKVDARRFAAFCSPNLPPLATVGADVTINQELVRKVSGKDQLVVHSNMECNVGLLRLYPGISASLVRAFLQPPLKGVVMETFGSGNGPTKPDLLQELRAAAEQGLVIVNCTHCLQGTVTSDYASGMGMAGAGIVSGFDMTSEAALAKLSYVLGQPGLSLGDRKELLAKDLRGEMTVPRAEEDRSSLQGSRVAWLLSLNSSQEANDMQDILMPSLVLAAAHAGDLNTLQALEELGRDLRLEDCSGQTPLHVAARRGHAAVVTMLLQKGVDVNAQNEDGHSPLLLAVRGRHQSVIGLLRAAGASLSPQELEDVGTELCRASNPTYPFQPGCPCGLLESRAFLNPIPPGSPPAVCVSFCLETGQTPRKGCVVKYETVRGMPGRLASRADSEGLQAWWQAGADLEQLGYDGHCALQVVSLPLRLKQLGIRMWWPCCRAFRAGLVPSPRPPKLQGRAGIPSVSFHWSVAGSWHLVSQSGFWRQPDEAETGSQTVQSLSWELLGGTRCLRRWGLLEELDSLALGAWEGPAAFHLA